MSRLFWMAVGATAGVAVTRKVTRTVDRFAPDGLAHGLTGLTATVRDFAEEVLASMAERECELRERAAERADLRAQPPADLRPDLRPDLRSDMRSDMRSDNVKQLPGRSPGMRRYAR